MIMREQSEIFLCARGYSHLINYVTWHAILMINVS